MRQAPACFHEMLDKQIGLVDRAALGPAAGHISTWSDYEESANLLGWRLSNAQT